MFGFAGCSTTPEPNIDRVKNVILLIGDGMGDRHVENGKQYFGIDKFDFEDDYAGSVITTSLSGTTDSAAAATALATGNKAKNGEVGQSDGTTVKNIMEIARDNGKKTGIITTDSLYGATPACFSSHTSSRSKNQEIIDDQLTSGIDLMIGKSSSTYKARKDEFEANGYVYSTDYHEIENLKEGQKYIGLLGGLRSKYNSEISDQADIEGMIGLALEFLDNENGFCLMIENAYIDKCSHGNDYYGMVCEVREFADMINEVYKFASGRDDTLIMVTADHETGGLRIAEPNEELSDELFSSTGHTGVNVNFYSNIKVSNENMIDNTDIFEFSKRAVENKNFEKETALNCQYILPEEVKRYA